MDLGRQGEEFVTQVAAETLFYDFIYERPHFVEANGNTREMCDLLAVLDADALSIQIKTQSQIKNRTAARELHWLRKQTRSASRQVEGSLRTIYQKDIHGSNRIRENVWFPVGSLTARHGIAVFDVTESEYLLPSGLPHHTRAGIPIHYFSFTDFLNLVQHLRSFPDLLDYLDQRSMLPELSKSGINNEKDTYAYYLTHEERFSAGIQRSEIQGWWDRLTGQHKASFDLKLEADQYAELIDQMITEAHEVDPDLEQYAGEFVTSREEVKLRYFEIASELNRLPALSRRKIGQTIYEKARLAAEGNEPRYFVAMNQKNSVAMAFLVSHLPRQEWTRRLIIILQAGMARLGVRRGVGVALNDMSLKGHAFNFVILDGLDITKPELQELAKTILGEMKPVDGYDFPDQDPNMLR